MKLKSIKMKGGSEYVMVKDKVTALHSIFPNAKIETEIIGSPIDWVFMKAKVTPDCSAPERFFIGHSQAKWTGMINGASALENAETSCVGRALAFLGIGIDAAMCSYDELVKAKDAVIPSNITAIDMGRIEEKASLSDITDHFVTICEDNQLTDADLYKFARGLSEVTCKKLGINFPAVPAKGIDGDEPFIGNADTALLSAIVKHSKLVVSKIRGGDAI